MPRDCNHERPPAARILKMRRFARDSSRGDSSDRLRARRIWCAKFHSGVGTTPEALVPARARRRDARLGASAVLRRRVHVRIGRGVEPQCGSAYSTGACGRAVGVRSPRRSRPRTRARFDPNSPPSCSPRPRPVPSRRQPFPDNHTDDSFLERLVLNGRITPRRLSRVVLDATASRSSSRSWRSRPPPSRTSSSPAASAQTTSSSPTPPLLALGVLVIAATRPSPRRAPEPPRRTTHALGLVALTPLFRTMTAAGLGRYRRRLRCVLLLPPPPHLRLRIPEQLHRAPRQPGEPRRRRSPLCSSRPVSPTPKPSLATCSSPSRSSSYFRF